MPTTIINNIDNDNSNNINSSNNNINNSNSKNKGLRGTDDQVRQEDRGAGFVRRAARCAGAEYRRPARGELNAYRFAAPLACGEAREDRCNPFCTLVAIRVLEKIAAAWTVRGGKGAGSWRRRGGGRGAPRIPPRAREWRRRGLGKCQSGSSETSREFQGAGGKHRGDCHTPQSRQRLEKEGLRLSEGRMQGKIRQGNQEKAMKALAACT